MQPEFITKFVSLRALFVLLVATSLLAFGPATAGADTASGNPELGPTLGDGYVYWVKAHGDGRYETLVVFQRRLSDGRTRTLFRTRRSVMSGLYSRGDKVAFAFSKIQRGPTKKRLGRRVDFVYAMSAEAAAPTMLLRSQGTINSAGRNCGKTSALHDISSEGQALILETNHDCAHGKHNSTARLYPLGGGARVTAPGMEHALWAVLQYGRLAVTSYEGIEVLNLANGQLINYEPKYVPYWVMLSPAGDLATADVLDYSPRRKKDLALVSIYAAGSTLPTAQVREWVDGDPILLFCTSGLVELNVPTKGPMSMRLRSLDGTVTKQLEGPVQGGGHFNFDSACVGNHLTLAVTRAVSGPPKTYGYDF